MRIAFFSALQCERTAFDVVNRDLGHEIGYFEERFESGTMELARGCGGVCVSVNDQVDATAIDALKSMGCEIIVTRSIGFNQIDLEAADQAGIPVARVPHYSPHSVSEFTVGLVLSLTRKIHRAFLRSREFNFSIEGLTGTQLSDKTVGILGAGQIGGLVLRALSGFGCRLLYHDLHRHSGLDDIASHGDLQTLTRESDILVLNLPLTPETRHTINAATVAQLKPGALIINTGRGALIDTEALVEGLKSGQVGGAAIDVYEDEAELFHADHSADVLQDDTFCRLLTFPNVIVTSHMAFLTDHALADIATTALRAFTEFEQGQPLTTRITPPSD